MKNIIRKVLRLTMVFTVSISVVTVHASASLETENSLTKDNFSVSAKENFIKEILDRYHESAEQIALNYHITSSEEKCSEYYNEIDELSEETVAAVNNAGIEAYYVTGENRNEIGNELKTDLKDLGIEDNGRYIVILHTGDNECYASSGAGFNYTYNGTSYLLRYLTLTAADNSSYGKASTVNVLSSSGRTVIQNCLDTALSIYISSISSTLGTVASICGLSISMFSTAGTSTLNMNCGTNWTRVYTQVWSSYDGRWGNGSCVEYARCSSYMSGQYYSASENSYVAVPQNGRSYTKYSSHYSDESWRKYNAVYYGYLNNWVQYDTTGAVKYYYGSALKITHSENF